MLSTRRKFIIDSAKVTLLTAVGIPLLTETTSACSSSAHLTSSVQGFFFSQKPLVYEYAALEPYIDAQTMEIHYSKHHATYIKNINDAILAEKIQVENEEKFLASISSYSAKARNNGGGAWNHTFFWEVMRPGSTPNAPSGKVLDALVASFGSFDMFKEKFTQTALSRFGSGWAWLVMEKGNLLIGSTPNQDNPLMDVSDFKGKPLLALDLWEHAYYLKYQNKRNEYIANWWNVVNWHEVAKRMS
jgi:superoxide dismutase, Fe-Mn family